MQNSDEIDLIELGTAAWRYKYVIGVTILVAVLAALYLALSAAPIYRSEAVVIEVKEQGIGGGPSLAGQLGGIAGLVGVKLGGAGVSEARAVLESNKLVEDFIQLHNLLPVLTKGASESLSVWRGTLLFRKEVLSIKEAEGTGSIRVATSWGDPKIAAQWANSFVALANETVRSRARDESERNVAYLNDQLKQTDVVELRRVLYNLLEHETQSLMLANAKHEYAFTVIDPARVPEFRTSPRRTLIVSIGAVLGMVLGVIVAFLHSTWRRHRARAVSPGRSIPSTN